MSEANTFSKIIGQSSLSQPCSRMSGQTPVAMSWSMARTTSTASPCLCVMPVLISISPSVLLGSGDRLSVQLMNSARRPVKSAGSPGWVSIIASSFLNAEVGVSMSSAVTPMRVTAGAYVCARRRQPMETVGSPKSASPGRPPGAAQDLVLRPRSERHIARDACGGHCRTTHVHRPRPIGHLRGMLQLAVLPHVPHLVLECLIMGHDRVGDLVVSWGAVVHHTGDAVIGADHPAGTGIVLRGRVDPGWSRNHGRRELDRGGAGFIHGHL